MIYTFHLPEGPYCGNLSRNSGPLWREHSTVQWTRNYIFQNHIRCAGIWVTWARTAMTDSRSSTRSYASRPVAGPMGNSLWLDLSFPGHSAGQQTSNG